MPRTEPARTGPSEPPARRPLVVTGEQQLLDELLRLCAAAGTEPEVVFDAPPSEQAWRDAPLVLLGDDAAGRVRSAVRRPGVLLLGLDLDDETIWRRAVGVGAQRVLFLPDAEHEAWLVERIGEAAEGCGREAVTVAVLGGRGGAGASTLACALALGAVRSGRRALLVDADPLGGGLDLLLGGEGEKGLRWPDLQETRGRVRPEALAASLPSPHGLPVLSFDRGEVMSVPPEAMAAVAGAARRRGGLVVVDLPRQADAAAREVLARAQLGLLVVPAELRAVAAAQLVAESASALLADLRVVVRGPSPSRVGAEAVAASVGLRLAGELGAEPGLADAQERGVPPGLRRGPLARFADRFVAAVLPSGTEERR